VAGDVDLYEITIAAENKTEEQIVFMKPTASCGGRETVTLNVQPAKVERVELGIISN
jgi:hypothetical protein